jgi:protein-tyrosine phosphatase
VVKVLFVCLGNICRSPMAEGVFRAKVDAAGLGDAIDIDSAGTGGWHVGDPPDPRAQATAAQRGYALEHLRARQVAADDFTRFDYLLAMDRSNLGELQRRAATGANASISLFLDYAPTLAIREVPDPYYGGDQGFEQVLDMIEAASEGLLAELLARLR